MKVLTRQPSPPLAEHVELLWAIEDSPSRRGFERVLPTGSMQLMVAPGERFAAYGEDGAARRYHDALFCGVTSRPVVIDPSSPRSMVGARFKAGGAFPFLGCPASELHNVDVPLDELWGSWPAALGEQLAAASQPDRRLVLLEHALLRRLHRGRQPHRAVALSLRRFEDGTDRVAEVVADVGLSSRRFADVFRAEVGLTPKLYCRVRRFQRVLGAAARENRPPWSELALDTGYFDQAHLNRDFKLFSGLTPGEYLAARGRLRNHVPLPS